MTTDGQVLEFELGAERYCVSLEYVTEIVDRGDLTAVPNTPGYVEGVMDLRGRTTAIVDPKALFDVEADGEPRRIVVFDPSIVEDGTAAGWLVDEVSQVRDVGDAEVDDAPGSGGDAIVGVLKREAGDFVIWVDPSAVHGGG